MFRLKPKILVFEFDKDVKESLHMMFMFFPIDVLFLDKNKKVVEIKKNFRPFTVYFPKNKYRYVIEAKELDYSIGQTIDF